MDEELRALARRWQSSAAPEDYERWVAGRVRATGLSAELWRSQDALAERGLPWLESRLDDFLARWRESEELAEWREPLWELLAEAFGPLAPRPDGTSWLHYDWRPGREDARERLLRGVQTLESYVRTQVELALAWRAPTGPPPQEFAERLARAESELTNDYDAWYYGAGELVAHFCELVGEPEPPGDELEFLAELCFTSWTLNDEQATRFGNGVALGWIRRRFAERYRALPALEEIRQQIPLVPEGEGSEALLPHLFLSLELDWTRPPARVAALLTQPALLRPAFRETGAQERYQASYDGPAHGDDPERAARFAAGLARARDLAAGDAPLDLDALRAIQTEVLGEPTEVRRGPALAKGGAEVYAWFLHLRELLEIKLAADLSEGDLSDGAHPVVRAARLYLDLIYAHPFPDGNARAALLGLELVLRRAGLPTPELLPLVRAAKPAGNAAAYWDFVALLAQGVAAAGEGAPGAGQ